MSSKKTVKFRLSREFVKQQRQEARSIFSCIGFDYFSFVPISSS